jgi:putative DNA methylase
LASIDISSLDNIKSLAYRAYNICERKSCAEEALAYNDLVTAWPSLIEKMNEIRKQAPRQQELEF